MYIRRKLYSYVEGDYVPVNETKLFSAKDDAKGAAAGAGLVTGIAGLGAAGVAAKTANYNKLNKQLYDATSREAEDAILEKIKKSGKTTLGAAKLARWANTNKKLAAGIAAGTIATGAAAGAGVKHLKNRNAEKQYSVLMTEEELRIFSEIVEDAGIGAGVGAATLGGAYAGRNLIGKAHKAVKERRNVAKVDAQIAAEKAREEFQVQNALAKGSKAAEKAKTVAEKKVEKAYKKLNKLSESGKIEKGLAALSKGGATATKWVKDNPKLAAGIAAGTIVTGAGVGAGVGAIKDKK